MVEGTAFYAAGVIHLTMVNGADHAFIEFHPDDRADIGADNLAEALAGEGLLPVGDWTVDPEHDGDPAEPLHLTCRFLAPDTHPCNQLGG